MLFSYKPTFINQNTRQSIPKHNEMQLKMNYSYSYANQNGLEPFQNPYVTLYNNNINTNQPKIKLYNSNLRVFDGIKHTKELTRMKRSCFTCG